MRNLFYLTAIIFIFCGAVSCGSKVSESRNPDARQLYLKSLDLYRHYSDSMRSASDSSEVIKWGRAFDDALTKLQYSYPPDLGLEISEGENDTLTKTTLRFIAIRDSLLRTFAHRYRADQDTVADSDPS